jgi:thiamine biosynthesis protein ThiS
MRIRVNGEFVELEASTIADVLRHYRLEHTKVVVEVNGAIVGQESLAATAVEDGMVLEIVHFVAGG